MSSQDFKRRRTGVLSTGYFNAVGLPGVQAVDENGDDIVHPQNKEKIVFNGDASQLFYPSNMFFVETENGNTNLKFRSYDADGNEFVRTIGELQFDGVLSNSDTELNSLVLSKECEFIEPDRGQLTIYTEPWGNTTMSSIFKSFVSDSYHQGVFRFIGVTEDEEHGRFERECVYVQATKSDSTRGTIDLKEDTTVEGNLDVIGDLSKETGSFKIPHPLPDKRDDYYLIHSFTESPQADLIYSGMTVLGSDGKGSVDLDAVSDMTNGTFGVLCKNVRRTVTNESGFEPVRSSFDHENSVLNIECNQKKAVEVFWMVIAQRNDEKIKSSTLTDDEGDVVVEKKKVENTESF